MLNRNLSEHQNLITLFQVSKALESLKYILVDQAAGTCHSRRELESFKIDQKQL